MSNEPSGQKWVAKFPTSNKVSDLKGSFAANAKSFISAMKSGGAKVSISATFRPPERAYLMHYSFLMTTGLDPKKVPAMSGVAIDWGSGDEGKKAAQQMVNAYNIVHSRL